MPVPECSLGEWQRKCKTQKLSSFTVKKGDLHEARGLVITGTDSLASPKCLLVFISFKSASRWVSQSKHCVRLDKSHALVKCLWNFSGKKVLIASLALELGFPAAHNL